MNRKEMDMNVRKKRGSGLLILYLTALLFSLSAAGCAFVNVTLYQPALPLQEKVIEGEGPGKLLLMDISGVLTYDQEKKGSSFKEQVNLVARVKEELRKASQDNEVKALVLRINTPGGTVSASDLLHHEIMQFKKTRKVKVVACLLGMATSGGYYVASAADHIVAQPTTLTGSIGTIALKFNVQGLMEKVGVEEETVKSGNKKDMWSPFRPATSEEKVIFQRIIDEYQGKFLEVVRAGRKNMTDSDLTIVRDGRVFSGAQALRLHLVDELGYLNDAVQWARAAAGVPKAQVIIYHRPGTYVDNVYSKSQTETSSWVERLQQGELLPQRPEPRFLYLWLP
jgi:protease-4